MKLKLRTKIFSYLIFSSIVSNKLLAQQVKKVDCCLYVENKATIIINNTTNSIATNSISTNSVVNNNGICNFKLNASANTSAGVYDTSNNLIRTLWSGVRYDAGCYNVQWDGNFDDGTPAPLGSYTVKILTNNVQYTWEGVVGNSSTDLTGTYVQKSLPLDMCFIGTTGYFPGGYSEHGSVQKQFSVSDPNKSSIPYYAVTTQSSEHVCTDGNIIYWAGGDYYSNDYWVFGAYPADNGNPGANMYPFSAGVIETNNNSGAGYSNYNYAISVTKSDINAKITGICVQNNGNFLFVARAGINQLQVLNKTSGVLLQTLTYPNIKSIACDAASNLFISFNNTVQKFTVNADGNLIPGTVLSGLTTPGTLAISPDFTTLAVAEDATNQIKFYNTPNGTATGNVLGQGGSFATNPYIYSDRFYHIDYIAYQQDGTIWIGDGQNSRAVHDQVDGLYVNQITNIQGSRSANVDPNNPARVFNGFIEYERDYTKTLDNGTNGSWKLKANWAANIGDADSYTRFRQVLTLSNGRTYAVVRHTDNSSEVYELTGTGARATGVYVSGNIGRDGTMFVQQNNNNDFASVGRQLLTGFDSSNNPVWGAVAVFATTPHVTDYTPGSFYFNDGTAGLTAEATKFIFFNPNTPTASSAQNPATGYHLGAVNAGASTYAWQASRSTSTDYSGDYPSDGGFDIGNGWPTQHNLTHAMVYNHDVFWNANGEFWKPNSGAPEINIWNHFNDNGLFIGQFGITGPKAFLNGASPAKFAGNAFGTSMCKVGNDYYIYHCDESAHAGTHSWHVTGLNTIAEQIIPLTVSAAITPVADPTNLMATLPYKSSGFYGSSVWTISPNAQDISSYGAQYPNWQVQTGMASYLPNDPDIYIVSDDNTNGTASANLGINNTNNWTLSGQYMLFSNLNNATLLNVIDRAGKKIVSFGINSNSGISVNNAVYPVNFNLNLLKNTFLPFIIQNNNGQISFTFNNNPPLLINSTVETGANPLQPKTFKIETFGMGDQHHSIISVKGLRFVLTN